MVTAELLSAITEQIVDNFYPLRIVLFGSQPRGDAGPGSDVDLLVVLPQVADKRKAAIEIRRVLAHLPVSRDIIVTTPEEIPRRKSSRPSFSSASLTMRRI